MIVDIRFCSGFILHNWKAQEVLVSEHWLKVIEENGAISKVNLDNVDLYTIYGERKEE